MPAAATYLSSCCRPTDLSAFEARAMGKILIAGGTVPFAGWLAAQLQAEGGHSVRVTATEAPREPLPRGVEFVLCGLDHNDTYSLGEAVYYGVEQIILLTNCSAFVGADDDDADDTAWLDVATRGCYNLLCAATAAEVRRVVVVSCMDVFASYGEDLAVDENFRPRPSLAPKQLGPHLTEYLTREFAHTHGGLNVTVARLGLLSPTNYGADEQRAVEALSGARGATESIRTDFLKFLIVSILCCLLGWR